MRLSKLLPVVVVAGSFLLNACSGTSSSIKLPAASLPASQAVEVSARLDTAPKVAVPQVTGDVASLQTAYETVYQNVNPSVVTIEVSSANPFGRSSRQGSGQNSQVVPTAEGSGFVWDTAGHIVTNNHVIDGAAKINVTFSDGSSYDAKLVGADPNADLAVIQVSNAPAGLLKPVTVGDSTQVKVGELVVAIGDPYGLSNTMTTGIVSAIGRSIQANANSSSQQSQTASAGFSIPDVIQTDAAINPGNSGGVLVDLNGNLIGVPTQIESASGSNSGVGFAIPSATVNRVVPQLISGGKASHSYLGISGSSLTPDMVSTLNLKAGQQGILVASVVAGGPAEKAGLKGTQMDANGNPTAAGDIITGIDGKTVNKFEDLVSYLSSSTKPGQAVTLSVLRGGAEEQMTLTLGTQPTN